jgi:hypothetical protein
MMWLEEEEHDQLKEPARSVQPFRFTAEFMNKISRHASNGPILKLKSESGFAMIPIPWVSRLRLYRVRPLLT